MNLQELIPLLFTMLLFALWWEARRIANALSSLAKDREQEIEGAAESIADADARYRQSLEEQDALDEKRRIRS
jgi:hypothetical protein